MSLLWANQLFLPISWLKCHWTTQLLGIITSLSGQMGLEDTLHSRWGCDSAICVGLGKPGSKTSKTSILMI